VEDACEAIGARSGGRIVGQQADISVLAFYPNKQITTGEGGAILTDDAEKAALCRSLRNQGRDDGAGWLAHERLGYNYRMDELAAALGVVQLRRLPEILEKRARVAACYKERLGNNPHLCFQVPPGGAEPSWFVFVVALAPGFTRTQRDLVLEQMRGRGIGCSNYFPPIHLQPFMQARYSFEPGDFPVCESLSERTIALPFHSNLSPDDVDTVTEALQEVIEQLEPAAETQEATVL